MQLIIDAGNTLIKLAVFNGHELVFNQTIEKIQTKPFLDLLSTYPIDSAILASTRELTISDFMSWWPSDIQLIEFDNNLQVPIGINYKTPETLGRDRIAGAVASSQLFPHEDILIISFGTAITIDFVSEKGIFEGGIISPGMGLRFKSLHTFTGKLPLVGPVLNLDLKGESTTQAIQYGVQNSIVFEISAYIARYKKRYRKIKVIITGGDAELFEPHLESRVYFEPFLVAKGLNAILRVNNIRKS